MSQEAGQGSRLTPRYVRQDTYYRRAKQEGHRSRAFYKLDDLLRPAIRLKPGQRALELGCWPGGWLERLAELVGPQGHVVGVDLEPVEPLQDWVRTLVLDFTEFDAQDQIAEATGGSVDALLSDAAPKLTGIRDIDRAAGEELHDAALTLAKRLLRPGGALIIKAFPGPEADRFRKQLRKLFRRVSEVRPDAKRKESREFYWVCSHFQPSGGKPKSG